VNRDSLRVPRQIGDLRLVENVHELGWLPVVTHRGGTLGSYVPRGFESGIRILDAIWSDELSRDLVWSDLGLPIGAPGVQDLLDLILSGNQGAAVARGEYVFEQMRSKTLEAIEGVIASSFPNTSRCLYALWTLDTYFESRDHEFAYDMSDIRKCYVYEGPLEGWRSLWPDILPSAWWSTDQAWCLTRDVDINFCFVAGPKTMTEKLLASDLPCVSVGWDDPF